MHLKKKLLLLLSASLKINFVQLGARHISKDFFVGEDYEYLVSISTALYIGILRISRFYQILSANTYNVTYEQGAGRQTMIYNGSAHRPGEREGPNFFSLHFKGQFFQKT